jgi:hypothetical protein
MFRFRSTSTTRRALAALVLTPLGALGCSGSSFGAAGTPAPDSGPLVDATDEDGNVVVVSGPDASSQTARDAGTDGAYVDAETGDTGAHDAAEGGPACTPGATTCAGDAVVSCTDAGAWSSPAPCPTGTPYCVGNGACGACMPGATQCSDSTSLQTCLTTGNWSAPTTCAGQACVTGSCGGVCVPGATQCANGGVETCSATGEWGAAAACSQGVCQAGACVGNCTPGSTQCSGNGAQTCGSSGQWGSVSACSGQTCVGGECTGVCAPTQTRCTTGNAVQSCAGAGQWGTATACSNQTCLSGQCQGVCAPGQSQCSGAVPQTCDASSGHWISGSVTAGQCGAVCTPGSLQCSSNGVETCGANGQWSAATACNDQTCVAGVCTGVCAPGQKQCSGNGVESCEANGQWSSASNCTNQTCSNGACEGVCAPGQTQCSGAVPQTCNSTDGQWTSGAITAGKCGAVCAPGAVQCSGNGVETCSSVGQWSGAVACTGQTPLCTSGACAPCTGGTTACDDACVNEQTDPNNCGACGHGCLGGTCAAGTCQPITLVSTSNAAGGNVVVDDTSVYWDNQANQVLSCPLGGGCSSGTVVYAAPENWLLYGLALPSATSPYNGFLYVGSADNTTDLTPYIVQVTKATRATKTTIVNGAIVQPEYLAFDSVNTWLYVSDAGNGTANPGTGGALERFKPDGTQFSVVLGSLDEPWMVQSLAIDSNYVYVSAYASGSVYFCPLSGSCGSGNVALAGLGADVQGIYSDGAHLWATAPGGGTVSECGAGQTCGTPTPVAAGQSDPHSVVADANHVAFPRFRGHPDWREYVRRSDPWRSGSDVRLQISSRRMR